MPTIRVSPNVEELAWQAAERVVKAAEDACTMTGRFVLALSGGNTPQTLYRLLANEFANRISWEKTHVLFVDERCVGPADPESNFGMACKLLLDRVPLPYGQIYRMVGEKDPAAAADEYDALLQKEFSRGADLAILGIGDDAHTASLFPHTEALSEKSRLCVANYVPQKGVWRLTMTAPYINRAYEVLVLAAGKGKQKPIEQALEGMAKIEDCPIRLINPATGRLIWLMDAEAAGMGMEDEAEQDDQDLSGEEAQERDDID